MFFWGRGGRRYTMLGLRIFGIPEVAATKKGIRKTPVQNCPNSPAGSEWKTSDVKAELDYLNCLITMWSSM